MVKKSLKWETNRQWRTLREETPTTLSFSTLGVEEQHICTVNTLIFSTQLLYSLRDEEFDGNHEMENMEDSSEEEESMDGDVFED